ncbi:hypothetical protein LI177_10405 [bacterium 210820-DFI.6.37]|nr:hypothetical protein [bacterium 210820-DFI.6.37]
MSKRIITRRRMLPIVGFVLTFLLSTSLVFAETHSYSSTYDMSKLVYSKQSYNMTKAGTMTCTTTPTKNHVSLLIGVQYHAGAGWAMYGADKTASGKKGVKTVNKFTIKKANKTRFVLRTSSRSNCKGKVTFKWDW